MLIKPKTNFKRNYYWNLAIFSYASLSYLIVLKGGDEK